MEGPDDESHEISRKALVAVGELYHRGMGFDGDRLQRRT